MIAVVIGENVFRGEFAVVSERKEEEAKPLLIVVHFELCVEGDVLTENFFRFVAAIAVFEYGGKEQKSLLEALDENFVVCV